MVQAVECRTHRRTLRANGIPYNGINVLMLWSAAIERGYAAPIWMTYRQAAELKANVRKGEHGSLVVYADTIIRTETDAVNGEETERSIPFLKGYIVHRPGDRKCLRQSNRALPSRSARDENDRCL
jgi:antirestriction protein ArdC